MQCPGTHLWLFILSPLDEEDYHTVAGNEAEKFPRFYDSPLPGERYPRDQNWSYSSHCRDGYLLSECCFGFSIRPTTKSHAEKPSCSAGAVCHVTGHFSTHCTNWSQLRPSFISASQIHPILLNFMSSNHTELILRKQNASTDQSTAIFTMKKRLSLWIDNTLLPFPPSSLCNYS